jgi:hypothetical protein
MPTKPSSETAPAAPLETVAAELERLQLRLRLLDTPDGPRLGLSPAGAVTPALRAGLAEHRVTITTLLRLWGDEAGSLLLRVLWHPAPLPPSPIALRHGRTAEDGPAWLADLQRRSLAGPAPDKADAEAFTRDLADLILLP